INPGTSPHTRLTLCHHAGSINEEIIRFRSGGDQRFGVGNNTIDPKKKGAIANALPPILQRLGLNPEQWLAQSTRFEAVSRQQRRRSAA
ncbi:hypothetical protein ACI5FT_16090, partial [Ectothiorhodospira haloalkaliphila]